MKKKKGGLLIGGIQGDGANITMSHPLPQTNSTPVLTVGF